MDVDAIMAKYGFSASSSCGGGGWYTRAIQHKGRDAFISVTDDGGLGLPESMDEPVLVCVYDMDSGEEVEGSKRFASLRSYIDSLKE